MTDVSSDIAEKIKRRARLLTTPLTVENGFYRWLVVDESVLPARDDKPRCIIVKAAPMMDPSDANSAQAQFTVEHWLTLEGLEGQRLTTEDAKKSKFFLKALFPDRIDMKSKEGDTWTFRGEPVTGKNQKEVDNAQSEQVITLGYELVEGITKTTGKTFYAQAKNGNNGRVFLNFISEEPNPKFEVGVPTEKV